MNYFKKIKKYRNANIHDEDENIFLRKRAFATGTSVVLGLLGLSAVMVAVFTVDLPIKTMIFLIALGAAPMIAAPFVFVAIFNAKASGKFLWFILKIETIIENNIHTKFSMIYNFSFAVLKIILGIYTSSYFFIVSAICSICFGLTRRSYIQGTQKSKGDVNIQYVYYSKISLLIMLGGASYGIYMAKLFFIPSDLNFSEPIAITIAAIAFSELYFAIRGMPKSKDVLPSAMKYVALASSLIAIAFTQVALTSISAEGTMSFWNAISGVIAGSLCIAMALFMQYKYRLHKKIAEDIDG